MVYNISCSQTFAIWSCTYRQPESRLPSAGNCWQRHKKQTDGITSCTTYAGSKRRLVNTVWGLSINRTLLVLLSSDGEAAMYWQWHKHSTINSVSPSQGPHYTTIMMPPKKLPPNMAADYVKVKCHFSAEIVRVWNSSSSFGDIILNIMNFPPLKPACFAITTYSLSTYVHRPIQMH